MVAVIREGEEVLARHRSMKDADGLARLVRTSATP
jgi:hypothetical protein